jgi:FAS-associated factor 2
MSVIAPLAGLLPPSEFLSKIRRAVEKHAPILGQLRSERAERDSVRSLREQQDSAYERSLARDRERAQQKREQEAKQKQEEAAARKVQGEKEHAAQNLEQWKLWRASRMRPTPAAGSKDAVNVRIKLPGGGMEVQRFDGGLDVEEIYAFVECKDILDTAMSKEASEPKDFMHEYTFRLVSPMPRVEYDLEDSGSIRERLGRNATLHVEAIDNE